MGNPSLNLIFQAMKNLKKLRLLYLFLGMYPFQNLLLFTLKPFHHSPGEEKSFDFCDMVQNLPELNALEFYSSMYNSFLMNYC